MTTTSDILASYKEALANQTITQMSSDDFQEQFLAPLQQVLLYSGDYLVPLSYYLNIIEKTTPLMIEYMTEEQKQECQRNVQIACLLLLAQKQYDLSIDRQEKQTEYKKQLKQCERLLDRFNPIFQEQSEAQQELSEEKPVKYLGLYLGIEMSAKMVEWINVTTEESAGLSSKANGSFEVLNWVNQRRLYWIWASSFIGSVLSSIPQDFFHTKKGTKTLHAPDPYTGTMSWALYYFRFSLHLGLFLKHTIAGPWMSEIETTIPFKDRFKTQWNLRKFNLLNDSLWATCNMAVFFWLTAQAGLGPWGDLFTIALLFYDLSASFWMFQERYTDYCQQKEAFEHEIELLTEKIRLLQDVPDADEAVILEIKEMQAQLRDTEKAFLRYKKEWDHYRLGLINESAYALALLIAFTLLALPFVPFAAPTMMAVTMMGAAMCIAFSVVYNAINTYLDVKQIKNSEKEYKETCAFKIKEFRELQQSDPESEQLKYLFLEIKQLQASSHYEEQRVVEQTLQFYRKTVIQAVFPALMIVSLVFLPTAIGIPVIAMVLIMVAISYKFIKDVYTPVKDEEIAVFPQEEFDAFCKRKQPVKDTFFTEDTPKIPFDSNENPDLQHQ